MEVSGQLHAPAALSPGKGSRYPQDKRVGVTVIKICADYNDLYANSEYIINALQITFGAVVD
jgi:hypothetical protein